MKCNGQVTTLGLIIWLLHRILAHLQTLIEGFNVVLQSRVTYLGCGLSIYKLLPLKPLWERRWFYSQFQDQVALSSKVSEKKIAANYGAGSEWISPLTASNVQAEWPYIVAIRVTGFGCQADRREGRENGHCIQWLLVSLLFASVRVVCRSAVGPTKRHAPPDWPVVRHCQQIGRNNVRRWMVIYLCLQLNNGVAYGAGRCYI